MLKSKIDIEKIHNNETKISTSQYKKAVKELIKPYVEGQFELDSLITQIKKFINPETFEQTMCSMNFSLPTF